jgi:hypothetical protein
MPLREAALVYVETGSEVNRDILTDAFRDAAGSFRTQLKTVEGKSLEIGCHQINMIFRNAIQLFQSDAIMHVFDLAPAPKDEDWPIAGHLKGEGSNLAVELIGALEGGNVALTHLGGPKREVGGVPEPNPIRISMTQNKFILLQQAAAYGASTICGAMADSGLHGDLQQLVGNTYQWTKALQRLVPDVVRVWKDPNYRMRLTDIEWGMIEPHPSGDANPALGGGGGNFFPTVIIALARGGGSYS